MKSPILYAYFVDGSAIGGKCSAVDGCNIPNTICEGEVCACASSYKIQDGACIQGETGSLNI